MDSEKIADRLSGIESRQKLILGNQKDILKWQQDYDRKVATAYKRTKRLNDGMQISFAVILIVAIVVASFT